MFHFNFNPMKNLLLIVAVVFMASCSSSRNGIKVTGFQYDNSYWQNQSNKIVHRNQRYARMEARDAKKESKMTKKILAVKAKEKKKQKLYLAQTFDHH